MPCTLSRLPTVPWLQLRTVSFLYHCAGGSLFATEYSTVASPCSTNTMAEATTYLGEAFTGTVPVATCSLLIQMV